jgi:protein subunit release factor A
MKITKAMKELIIEKFQKVNTKYEEDKCKLMKKQYKKEFDRIKEIKKEENKLYEEKEILYKKIPLRANMSELKETQEMVDDVSYHKLYDTIIKKYIDITTQIELSKGGYIEFEKIINSI